MNYTEKEVLELGSKLIQHYHLDFDPNFEFQARFNANNELLRGFGKANSWTIFFRYGIEDFGTGVLGMLTILDENLKPLYFHTKSGIGVLTEKDLEGFWA